MSVVVAAVVCCGLGGLAGACAGAAASAEAAESSGRAYELVSPAYKAGYSVERIAAVSPQGERAGFVSRGSFAGAPTDVLVNHYMAHRTEAGWLSQPLNAPATVWPYAEVSDYSPSLGAVLVEARPGANAAVPYEGDEIQFLTLDTDLPDYAENFDPVGQPLVLSKHESSFTLRYDLANEAFSHVVVVTRSGQNLLPAANTVNQNPYELSAEGLRLVDVDNKGKLIAPCSVSEVGSHFGKGSLRNAVSNDAAEIFFMADVGAELGAECKQDEQVFVRLGGARTLEVSKPLDTASEFGGCVGQANGVPGEVPCAGAAARRPAEFQGASEDGTRVYFTTAESLLGSDSDSVNDLYMATIECPAGGQTGCAPSAREVRSLTQVSHGSAPAEVQGVVAASRDGSHVYFVARGVLSGPNADGLAPREGADNLYVYDNAADNAVGFVADLCSGPEASGAVRSVGCSQGLTEGDKLLWQSGDSEAQLNECALRSPSCEDGRFIVFASYAKILPDDTDEAKDIYRYDAATGTLARASIGENGYDKNGNDAHDAVIAPGGEHGAVAEQHDANSRALSEDGSRVLFTTAGPLSAAAGNGLTNAYEWHEGAAPNGDVALVSTGNSDQPVGQVVISSNGRDVFFLTTQGLAREDTDGQVDLYDARIGGGFPLPESATRPCTGDACQGPLTSPPPAFVSGSAYVTPGEGYRHSKARSRRGHKRKGRHRPRRKPRKRRASRRGRRR